MLNDDETKKTLSLRAPEERPATPALQRKGRGWNIAESRLDTLHETAREMRRNPTAAQAALAEKLAAADLGRFRFRRQVVIGSAIVDFACQPLKLVIELNEADANEALDSRRDASLEAVGVKVLRYSAADVLADPEGATHAILGEMKLRWNELRANAKPRRPQSSGYASSGRPSGDRPASDRRDSDRRDSDRRDSGHRDSAGRPHTSRRPYGKQD